MTSAEPATGVPTVGIVGLGLIGGSLARALLARGVRVLGVTRDAEDAALAARAGVVVRHNVDALAADLPPDGTVVVATPLAALAGVGEALVARLPADTVVLHAAGLQRAAATGLGDAARARVLGTHPLAGSHETGFAASRDGLFAGATVWAESRADAATRRRVEWLWAQAGVRTVTYATADAHDAHMAWVSHLPQLAAVALAGAMAAGGRPAAQGGPGLRDATRLAASPFPLWRDLLAAAPAETGAALGALAASIEQLGAAFARGDERALAALWERARAWRAAPVPTADHTAEEDAMRETLPVDTLAVGTLSTSGGGPRW